MTNLTVENEYTSETSKFVSNSISNTKSDLIEITSDKLEIYLLKHKKKWNARSSWIAPVGIFISTVFALATATFTNQFGISAALWQALFIAIGGISFVWSLKDILYMARNWEESTTDHLILCIKDNTPK